MLLFIAPVWRYNLHFTIASVLSIEKVCLLFYMVEGYIYVAFLLNPGYQLPPVPTNF